MTNTDFGVVTSSQTLSIHFDGDFFFCIKHYCEKVYCLRVIAKKTLKCS